jgi:Kef-type K+ transport system membrane component KefB
MIGEVLVGVLLGPSLLGILSADPATELGAILGVISTLGVFFLAIAAGLELGSEGLRQALREGTFLLAATEFLFPFALGFVLAQALGLAFLPSLFVGTALSVTALPVSIRIFMDLNQLQTKLGRAVISVAMVNDILAFILLGAILQLEAAGETLPFEGLAIGVGKVLVFVALLYAVRRLVRYRPPNGVPVLMTLAAHMRTPESPFAIAILLSLFLGAVAELVGLHFVIGVFYGALLLSPETVGAGTHIRIQNTTRGVGFGFLAAIFFAVVGIRVSLLVTNWQLVIIVTAFAFVGKIIGGLIGGALAGFRGRTLAALGVGLNARGMMELVLAEVGLASGIIGPELYAALVLMTIVTTLTTPLLLRVLLRIEWKAAPGTPGYE